MMPALLAAAARRLFPILVQSGSGFLANIVRRRAPGVATVIEKISGAFGTAATADAIADRFESADDQGRAQLLRMVREVEDDGLEYWQGMVQDINLSMRAEMKAKDWLQRNWRPIFALSSIVLIPVYVVLLFWLLLTGRVEEGGVFSGVLMLLLPLQLGVLGVYAGGRSYEKARGAD